MSPRLKIFVILLIVINPTKNFAQEFFASSNLKNTSDWKTKARLNLWSLYLMDNFDTQRVVDVYSGTSCDNPGNLVETVFGRETAEVTARCNSVCCIERIIRDHETVAERIISNNGTRSVDESFGTGDTWLTSLGVDAESSTGPWLAKVHGNLLSSLKDERTRYGHDEFRYQFSDLFVQRDLRSQYRLRVGRQAIQAGVLVDGVRADYFFGSANYRDSKSIGLFGGLAAHPISKKIDLDRSTFGSAFRWIPEFSGTTDAKLQQDNVLVGELYKNSFNRLYLFSHTQFTPIRELTLSNLLTVDLPAPGDDGQAGLNYSSLHAHWRPNREWFASTGFTQFKIDRYLKEESVRWATDEGSGQVDRVGDTLDRSHRYRFDVRTSYKPVPFAQPYVKARYEQRSFDANKTRLNRNPLNPTDPAENLSLTDRKNAYRLTSGLRLFPWDRLETDSQFSYDRKYQSKAYLFSQWVGYDASKQWSADANFDLSLSRRNIYNSVPDQPATDIDALDYYMGAGGSYKFFSNWLAQLRYDFSREEDASVGRDILIHSFWARLDYKF